MDQRNLLLAVVFSVGILLLWQFLYEQPRQEAQLAEREAAQQQEQLLAPTAPPTPGMAVLPTPGAQPSAVVVPGARSAVTPSAPPAVGALFPTAPVVGAPEDPGAMRAAVLRQEPRIRIQTPRLHGSIRLKGAQIDDLTLASYRETVKPESAEITLLSPTGLERPYFTQFGWVAASGNVRLPDAETVWTADNNQLSVNVPVTLRWDNGAGLRFTRTVSIDENYMFSITQTVVNNSSMPVTLYPYGLISRTGVPDTLGFYILHEGLLGVFDGKLKEVDYDDLDDAGQIAQKTTGGWIGITDKYWLVALVPDQKAEMQTNFRHTVNNKIDKYQADYLGGAYTIAPGAGATVNNRLFAGAKEVRLLDAYEEKLGIARFDLAVDFGWFYFLTKPIFYVLAYFYDLLGNFRLAILLLTVLIKLLFFPLANKSYVSISAMKKLQPKMVTLRERYKDNKTKQNEAMMKLYRDEKVNPASGCLPIVIQIPVFFALYKVLFVSIEMRHTPFYGWIQDLSAPDPTTLFNLFGLIPWTPPDFLMIGVWPIMMGATMFLQQKLNPAPADPMQAKVFMFLPFVFTIMLASFPAGLVIYWTWNNLLSITQQWVIMRRMGVKIT